MTTVMMTLAPGRSASSMTMPAKMMEARPRGPNHPRYSTDGRPSPEPIMARATGTIRMSVRLSAA